MNERLRMQYLEAMEIDTFVPRYRFPQAAPPVLCCLPASPESDHSPLPVTAVQPVVGRAELGGLRRVDDILQSPPIPVAASGSVAQSAADAQQAPAAAIDAQVAVQPEPDIIEVRFALDVWRVSPSLLVVDSREVAAALPTEALLANIMRSCGNTGRLVAADRLHWPLVDIPGKPQGWPEACEMVATFLEGKLSNPVAQILLLGEAAYNAVLGVADKPAYGELLWCPLSLDSLDCRALVLPSLSEILRNNGFKPKVWRCLCENAFVQ